MSCNVYIIRHGQSGNRGGLRAGPASPDPALSDLGRGQAADMAAGLAPELGRGGDVVLISSPMRRCLLTAKPLIDALRLPRDRVVVHGALYEFKCCGAAYRGTTGAEIMEQTGIAHTGVHFSAIDARWNYFDHRSPKETSEEALLRGAALAGWLREVVAAAAAEKEKAQHIVVVLHQTIGDMVLQLLVDGTAAQWRYGAPRYKMKNAGVLRFRGDEGGNLVPNPPTSAGA